MNHQAGQYRSLTSSIKTWMSECRAPSTNAILHNILSLAYGRQERAPEIDVPVIAPSEIDSSLEERTNVAEILSANPNQQQPLKVNIYCVPSVQKPDLLNLNPCGDKIKCETANADNRNFGVLNSTIESEFSYKTANETNSSAEGAKEELQLAASTRKSHTLKRNLQKYPESIRAKIQFFEGCALVKQQKASTTKTIISIDCSHQIQNNQIQPSVETGRTTVLKPKSQEKKVEEESAQRKPPIITEMILKQKVIDQFKAAQEQKTKTHDETKDRDVGRKPEVSESAHVESFFEQQTTNDSTFSQRKNKEDEKFIVNLYEFRSSKKWPKVKAAVKKGGYVRVNSELFIRELPKTENLEVCGATSRDDKTTFAETSEVKWSSKSSTDQVTPEFEDTLTLSASSVSRSNISVLLDKSTSISNSSATILDETVSSTSDLLEEVHNQGRILQQATKAVEVCSTTKELVNGEEQLEAERILLLAGLKRALLLQQLREQEYGDKSIHQFNNGEARLVISDMEIPLMLPEDHQNYKIWYIITCTCESILQASKLIQLKRHCHFLNFPGTFVFENVNPYSVVNLRIYQVKIPHNPNGRRRTNNFWCINQINTCARKPQKVQYKDFYSGMLVQSEVLPSIFTLCGDLSITMDRLLNTHNFLFQSTPNESTLFGSLKLSSNVSNLSMKQNHFGFITMGTGQNGCITWDRKWCRLQGTNLLFWDNPSEEGLNEPKTVVNLKNCMEDKVIIPDKDFCRRHAIIFEIASCDGQNLVFTKCFLSADTNTDLKIWKKCINSVLNSLRLWKSLGEQFEA